MLLLFAWVGRVNLNADCGRVVSPSVSVGFVRADR